jgi:hypothetical protein
MKIMERESAFCKAHVQLREMIEFVRSCLEQGRRIDQVERGLFDRGLQLGLSLLEDFVAQAGDGDAGETLVDEEKTLRRLPQTHGRTYRSIFGNLRIERFVYGTREGQKIERAPLDAQLGLPAGEQSYVLEDWLQRLCVKESYGEGVGSLREIFGIRTGVRSAERMNRDMAQRAEPFRLTQPTPDREQEEDILVLTADGKGVPMRRPLEARLRETSGSNSASGSKKSQSQKERAREKKRFGRGEKRTRKQMAYVGAVYSIAPFARTADDILDDLRRRQCQAERPRPQNKRLWAEMTQIREGEVWEGQPRLFLQLAWEAYRRDPDAYQAIVCLMDGERSLWKWRRRYFPRAVPILDIFHVNERLWKAAYCFHPEQSREAEQFVDHYLRMILEGKVSNVCGRFRRLAREHDLKGQKRKTLFATIQYLHNNRDHMRYDEYLAAGFPIGSGVVEGACRHLVKDRLEQTGMRWDIEGAQSMVQLRSIYLNGDWGDFVKFRIKAEQQSLYGQAA